MIVYFGHDEHGYFADSQEGVRQYVAQDLWLLLVEAGRSTGAQQAQDGRLPLRVQETITLKKFENGQLIETLSSGESPA